MCLYGVRIALLNYHSHAKGSVQVSLEPQVSKAGEISVVAKLGERKPKCFQVSVFLHLQLQLAAPSTCACGPLRRARLKSFSILEVKAIY